MTWDRYFHLKVESIRLWKDALKDTVYFSELCSPQLDSGKDLFQTLNSDARHADTVKIRCMGLRQFNEAYLITNLSRQYSLMTNRKSIAWKQEHQKVILNYKRKKTTCKKVALNTVKKQREEKTVKSSDLPPGRVWRFVFGISPRACFCWQLTLNGLVFIQGPCLKFI